MQNLHNRGCSVAPRTAVQGRRYQSAMPRTAVITDLVLSGLVLSGQVAQYKLRCAVGLYNLLNWQYPLPASPYASRLMPQQGRSSIFSLTLAR